LGVSNESFRNSMLVTWLSTCSSNGAMSKPSEGYTQNTQNVAAVKCVRDYGLSVHPEQDIESYDHLFMKRNSSELSNVFYLHSDGISRIYVGNLL